VRRSEGCWSEATARSIILTDLLIASLAPLLLIVASLPERVKLASLATSIQSCQRGASAMPEYQEN